MSCTPVRPWRTASASASVSARSASAWSIAGATAATRRSASSMNTPVGSPAASRTINPPSGCPCASCAADAGSAAIARSAAEFTHPAWPSTRPSQTGRSGNAASRSAAVGKACSGQSFWSQPRPISHSPGGSLRSNARRRSRISCLLRVPTRSTRVSARPSPTMCPWASISPGMTVASPSSSLRAPGYSAASASASPTARMRPSSPQTMASATGLAGSEVWILAACSRVSAWAAGARAAAHSSDSRVLRSMGTSPWTVPRCYSLAPGAQRARRRITPVARPPARGCGRPGGSWCGWCTGDRRIRR